MLLTILIFYFLSNWFGGYAERLGCEEVFYYNNIQGTDCLGVSNIYRISFVLMWLYVFLIIFMCFRGEIAKAVNEGLWSLKLLGILSFFIGCCFISSNFFNGYVYFAIAISGLYMLF